MHKLSIKRANIDIISIFDMEDGQIGEIVTWGGGKSEYSGRIIQRHSEKLISLGLPSGKSWPHLLHSDYNRAEKQNYLVRLLQPGDSIVVE